jgi:hypothetical protein
MQKPTIKFSNVFGDHATKLNISSTMSFLGCL